MDIFEFMNAVKIPNTDVQVRTVDHLPDTLEIIWTFESPEHPKYTHRRISRLMRKADLGFVKPIIQRVTHNIEVHRNAKHDQ